jgi:HSP20 family protein
MAASGTRAPLGKPMDVYRGEDGSYHVEADLPGADPDSIEVTVEHGVLTIRAERTPHYGDSEQVIAAERPVRLYARQPSGVALLCPCAAGRGGQHHQPEPR